MLKKVYNPQCIICSLSRRDKTAGLSPRMEARWTGFRSTRAESFRKPRALARGASFLALAILLVTANCFAQAQKISKLMPRDTQLLSQKQDKSQELVIITTYKYGSASTKEKVLEFYRQLFKNESYQELVGYSVEKQKAGPHRVYFFTKANELAVLSITTDIENGLGIYYVALHEPNVEAVKGFDTKEKQYKNE